MKLKGILVILVASLSLAAAPVCASLAYAQASSRGPAPVEQPLVNEGHYAVSLATGLHLTTSHHEAAAENALSSIGIEPRNGWISDYPMTPDIIAEVRESTAKAASSGSLQMAEADATGIVDKVSTEFNLPVTVGEESGSSSSEYAATAPIAGSGLYDEGPAYIDDYYQDYGPPVVSYYPPPWDWYWLYAWVPYPFWWGGFGFGGFFILADFDRDFHGEHFSNHFRDRDGDWKAVDPATRSAGRAASTLSARANSARMNRMFNSTGARTAARSLVSRTTATRNAALGTRAGNMTNASRAGSSLARGNTGRTLGGVNRSFANNHAGISNSATRPSFSGRGFSSSPSVHAFNGGNFRGGFNGGGFHAPAFSGGGFGGGFHGGGFGGGFHGGGFGGGGGFHGGGGRR